MSLQDSFFGRACVSYVSFIYITRRCFWSLRAPPESRCSLTQHSSNIHSSSHALGASSLQLSRELIYSSSTELHRSDRFQLRQYRLRWTCTKQDMIERCVFQSLWLFPRQPHLL